MNNLTRPFSGASVWCRRKVSQVEIIIFKIKLDAPSLQIPFVFFVRGSLVNISLFFVGLLTCEFFARNPPAKDSTKYAPVVVGRRRCWVGHYVLQDTCVFVYFTLFEKFETFISGLRRKKSS